VNDGSSGAILVIVLLAVAYWLPTIVALKRRTNRLSVFLLNGFLGWSVIGCIIALKWALENGRNNQVVINNVIHNTNNAPSL
jgi:hypothetical protein